MGKKIAVIRHGIPVPASKNNDDFSHLPPQKRAVATSRQRIVMYLIKKIESGVSQSEAIVNFLANAKNGAIDKSLVDALDSSIPSKATLHRWINAYQEKGIGGLVPKHKGSDRMIYGWEARFLYYKQKPQRVCCSTIALWLREEGFETATDSRVRAYNNSLPKHLTDYAPKRTGQHFYRQNHGPYIVRNNDEIPAGLVYVGDGHCCDVYVQHPATGKHFRPELTVWQDLRTSYVAGWWLSESESAVTTIYSLSHAIVSHNHVPAAVYTDPGSGFKNKLINDEAAGYLARMSIEHIVALPGNAKAKPVERWFGIFEERVGKKFDSYCGHCRTDDALSRFETKVRRGEITVPSLLQYRDEIARGIELYNNTPLSKNSKYPGMTPAQMWGELESIEPIIPIDAIVRPREICMVRRTGIRLHSRLYRDPVLAGYEGDNLTVEYDLHDASSVNVRDAQDRLVCIARLVEARPGLPSSRIEDLKQNRLKGQIKRKQKQIDEQKARAGLLRDHTHTLATMTQLTGGSLSGIEMAEPAATGSAGKTSGITLDILNADYVDKDRNGNRTE